MIKPQTILLVQIYVDWVNIPPETSFKQIYRKLCPFILLNPLLNYLHAVPLASIARALFSIPPSPPFKMKSYIVLIFTVCSAVTAKPLPDDGSDGSIVQENLQILEILQVPELIAAAPSQGTNSIFTTNWSPSQYQPSTAGDISTGLSNSYQPSNAGDPSAGSLGSLVPSDFGGDDSTIPTTGELVSETLYQSDPPCINDFWAACCNGKKFCIFSKLIDFEAAIG